MIEHLIRNWLVDNPEFIEEGLTVIEKEHHLRDTMGSSGFIDILCKDFYNNFVIIEIKRSDSAARQAFTEVFKYAELLKNCYNARNSELRIIIISTHWNEIIRAFSYACFNSSFPIKGLKITIDKQTKIPLHKEDVIPISTRAFSRKFMSSQMLYLFRSKEKRRKAHLKLDQQLLEGKAFDYVTIDLDGPEAKELPFPYAINLALQKRSKEEFLDSLTDLQSEELIDLEEEEFDNEDEQLNYLEENFIAALDLYEYTETAEAGNAEKFESITGVQEWKITAINRFGIFKDDPRYSKELLLSELKGHDGNSHNKFVAFSESTQKERLKEIRLGSKLSLSHTPNWADLIDQILLELETTTDQFKILVDIYNPDSIVGALYFAMREGNPDYLPLFSIIIDYPHNNQTILYRGEVNATGTRPVHTLVTSTDHEEVSNECFSLLISPDNLADAFDMGLQYAVLKVVVVDDNEILNQYVKLDKKNLVRDDQNYTSIEEYIETNQQLLSQMVKNCSRVYGHF